MILAAAARLAAACLDQLAPYCEQIEIAGSIRRRRHWCNDVDLACLLKEGRRPALIDRLRQRCQIVTEGAENLIVKLPCGNQLDLFLARPPYRDLLDSRPTNFGSIFLCRTGSREHNIFLVEHAKTLGLVWKPYQGVFDADGYCLASATEADIFKALDLPFIPPEQRERP